MLYYNFKNHEEFKNMFGIMEHGNGQKSRKNKILLALHKDRNLLRQHIAHIQNEDVREMLEHARRRGDSARNMTGKIELRCEKMLQCNLPKDLLAVSDLATLKNVLLDMLTRYGTGCYFLKLNGRVFHSNLYETDDMKGLCEDGTANAIRYRNIERDRVFKMKAGKMFNHIISCCPSVDALLVQRAAGGFGHLSRLRLLHPRLVSQPCPLHGTNFPNP